MARSQNKIFPRESSPWTHRVAFLGVPLCSPDDSHGGTLLRSSYICAWTLCLELTCSSTLPWFCLSCANHLSLRERKVISGTGGQGFPRSGESWREGGWPFADAQQRWGARAICRAGLLPASTLTMSTALLAARREVRRLAITVCLFKIAPKTPNQN